MDSGGLKNFKLGLIHITQGKKIIYKDEKIETSSTIE